MRLEDIELCAQASVVNNVRIQCVHNLGGNGREFDSRSRPRDGMAREVLREGRVPETLADDVQVVPLVGDGRNELRAPLAHSAAARIQVVDHEGDAHLCGPLPRTPVD